MNKLGVFAQVKEIKTKSDCSDMANVMAARAALLDLYGDRATSFVSLFLASIFGLVTISAIVQTMLFSMVEQVSSQTWYLQLSPNFFFIAVSMILFVVFVVVALYTYNRYTFYSDLSDKLTRSEMRSQAELDSLSVSLAKKDCDEKLLKSIAEEYASTLKDEDKSKAKIIEKENDFIINFVIYEKYRVELQKQNRLKKIIDSGHFKTMTCLLFLGLALLTYYPLFTLFFKN